MNRVDLARVLGPLRRSGAVVIGPGLGGRLMAAQGDEPLTIYNMEMAYVTPTALGIALGWPVVKVVAMEGDGSMLMGQAALTTVARYRPPNLIILVCDNGRYLTTGSGTALSATSTGTDIERIAIGAGFERTATVRDLPAAEAALKRAFTEAGPWLIVAKIEAVDRELSRDFVPLPVDCYESGQRFRQHALAMGAPHAGPAGNPRR